MCTTKQLKWEHIPRRLGLCTFLNQSASLWTSASFMEYPQCDHYKKVIRLTLTSPYTMMDTMAITTWLFSTVSLNIKMSEKWQHWLSKVCIKPSQSADQVFLRIILGTPFNHVGKILEEFAAQNKITVCDEFSGHGIGHLLHMPPMVLHRCIYLSKIRLSRFDWYHATWKCFYNIADIYLEPHLEPSIVGWWVYFYQPW